MGSDCTHNLEGLKVHDSVHSHFELTVFVTEVLEDFLSVVLIEDGEEIDNLGSTK